jgi:proline iminopeptidase
MPLPEGEGIARLGDVEIRYFVAGKGPRLVVHPGGPGMEWKYLRMPRLEKMLQVIYLDPRGAGGSSRAPSPEAYRMERMVEDLDAFRAHLGLERMALMGHSHGGMVAQQYAISRQALLTKLILACTTPYLGREWVDDVEAAIQGRAGEPWFPEARRALADHLSARTERALREALLGALPLYFHRWEPFRARILRDLGTLRVSPEPLRIFQERDAPRFDTREKLRDLRVPTLVLAGRHDAAAPPRWAAELKRLIPRSRLSIFERSGHFPFIEEEEPFALAVGTFLIAD